MEKAKFCSHNCYGKSLAGVVSKRKTGKYIECKRCKKEFWVQPNEEKNGRKYCSSKCYHNSPSQNIGKKYPRDSSRPIIKRGTYQKCEKCGKDFYVYPYRKNVRFCSMECSKTGTYQKCKICGKEFWVKKCHENTTRYCSKKCSDIGLKTGKYQKCKICGKEFYVTADRLKRGKVKFCSIECVGYGNKGINNCNWKGGISPLNRLIRCLPKYNDWRVKIYERDKFICQMPNCDKTIRYLYIHHIKKFIEILIKNNIKTVEEAMQCLELWDITNGITLCRKCHRKTYGHEQQYAPLFQPIINSKLK